MLRLNPTAIRLDARDLQWHEERYQQRQAERSKASELEAVNKKLKNDRLKESVLTQGRKNGSKLPVRILPDCDSGNSDEQDILSQRPVPHQSQMFWNEVLAHAGTPTRIQSIESQNARIVEPSEGFIESNRSSRASLAGSDSSLAASPEAMKSRSLARQSTVIKRKDLKKYYDLSLNSTQTDLSNPDVSDHQRSPMRDRVAALLRRQNGQVDGPQDQEVSRSIEDTARGESGDDLNLSQHNRRSISSKWMTQESMDGSPGPSSHTVLAEDHAPGSKFSPWTIAEETLSSIRLPAFNSSSRTPEDFRSGVDAPFSSGLLSQPPRRRHKNYRPRTESYPYHISDELQPLPSSKDQTASPADMEGMIPSQESYRNHSTLIRTTPSRQTSFSPPYVQLHGTPPDALRSLSQQLSNTSISSHSTTSIMNPGAATLYPNFDPSSSRKPSINLPPPFSSTPRNISMDRVLPTVNFPPTGTPDGSPMRPGHWQSPPLQPPQTPRGYIVSPFHWQVPRGSNASIATFPTTPSSTSSSHHHPPPNSLNQSPSPHPTIPSSHPLSAYQIAPPPTNPTTPSRRTLHSSIPVYNDALPPHNQPRTPFDLRPGNREALATRNPFSAPPRAPAVLVRITQGTPTREGREEQGPLGAWNEFARRGIGVGVGEMGGQLDGAVGRGSPRRVGGRERGTRWARESGENRDRAGERRDRGGGGNENEGMVITGEERVQRRRRVMALGMGREETERSRGGL